MKIDERKALNTQKPQSEKVSETPRAEGSSKAAKHVFAAEEDRVALESQDRLRALALTPSAEELGRVEHLRQLVQSGQYQVDPLALGTALVAAMLKGY